MGVKGGYKNSESMFSPRSVLSNARTLEGGIADRIATKVMMWTKLYLKDEAKLSYFERDMYF